MPDSAPDLWMLFAAGLLLLGLASAWMPRHRRRTRRGGGSPRPWSA